MAIKDPPKFTQIGIFGLKICHLATLDSSSFSSWRVCVENLSPPVFVSLKLNYNIGSSFTLTQLGTFHSENIYMY
jgi:hypothetical protein